MKSRLNKMLPVVLTSVALGATFPAHAGERYDQRVREACEEKDLNFKRNQNGDYQVRIQWEWRFQEVVASSKTFMYAGKELRAIYTTGWKGTEENVAETAKRLLLSRQRIGSWKLIPRNERWEAVYTIHVPANCSSEEFYRAVFSVAAEADGIEEDLMKTNQF
jgi:hypothetical protein